jgi:hypothetical protein
MQNWVVSRRRLALPAAPFLHSAFSILHSVPSYQILGSNFGTAAR